MKKRATAVLITDERDRFQVTVTKAIIDGNYSSAKLLYLEVAGSMTATEAIRARIANKRNASNRRSYTATDVGISIRREDKSDHALSICGKARYQSVRDQTESGVNRCAILHEGFSQFKREYVLGGTSTKHSKWFANFARTLEAPILDCWLPTLWKVGVDERLISKREPLVGVTRAWRVNSDGDRWRNLVSDLVETKKLRIPRN